MLFPVETPAEKRKIFREQLKSGKLLRFPGSFSPLVSMMIEKKGFEGVYISGSVLSNDLGYPDIGLTTLTEVAQRGRQISRTTKLPSIIDADTGWGEPMNVTRTIQEFIEMGLAGCHLEDQMNPKRCGHLDNKSVVPTGDMVKKIKAAVTGKRLDSNFLIIARTDSRASEGLDGAIERAKAYVDAGAEMIFPEALQSEHEFEAMRKAIHVPLLANMTEFGKGKLYTTTELANLGYNMVIYPVTTFRLAMGNTEKGLDIISRDGTQEKALELMQTRQELYDLTRYQEYNEFDQSLYNFKL
ncbi:MAG: methylisocitrate lyase [Bdellovibrionales bacterium RIFCSPHIGHO2_01_FULL_40_29]|nr:MAG: methylisocitrate lyase [Bdellovibrionales bacterium RIFCSPHIGHO2_01_FULL_40_29]OFZ32703.1 MAG: methylisocitrate lyase [Bdellovibrionales bacterium RIFCSPHIGHO2_02_FULL_40_15]